MDLFLEESENGWKLFGLQVKSINSFVDVDVSPALNDKTWKEVI